MIAIVVRGLSKPMRGSVSGPTLYMLVLAHSACQY